MSLNSAGISISISEIPNGNNKLGHGFSNSDVKADAEIAFRAAVEEFIASEKFKQFTTTSCYNSVQLNVEFLLHTVMPR